MALRQTKQAKKHTNLENSTQMLIAANIPFKRYNNGVHLFVNNSINYWPSTGLWITQDKQQGRGIRNLLKYLETKC